MITLHDIKKVVREHENFANIKHTVETYLQEIGYEGTALQWARENYALLRSLVYPHYSEYLDAQVKLLSGDKNLSQEGQAQLDKYVQDCLAVKVRFPKL